MAAEEAALRAPSAFKNARVVSEGITGDDRGDVISDVVIVE